LNANGIVAAFRFVIVAQLGAQAVGLYADDGIDLGIVFGMAAIDLHCDAGFVELRVLGGDGLQNHELQEFA
jgi:hypothetical protein